MYTQLAAAIVASVKESSPSIHSDVSNTTPPAPPHPAATEKPSKASSPSNSDDAVVVDKNMFKQVAMAVQELKISRGDFQRIDSKFTKTAQEVANDKHINAHPALLAYKTYTQKVWNELFLAAVLMNSGRFQIDATSNTESAAKYVLQSLTQSLPVASTLMSIACGTHDALKAARLKGGFQNVSKLSPSSDVVIFGNLSDHIASECTLAYHSEINNSAFIKEKTRFSKMKGAMINAVSKIDDKFARGFFENKDLNDTQCVALDHASICAAHLMSMKTSDIDAIAGDKHKIANVFLDCLRRKYTSSGRVNVPIDDARILKGSDSHAPSGSSSGGGGVSANISFGSASDVQRHSEKLREMEKQNETIRKDNMKAQRDAEEARKTGMLLIANLYIYIYIYTHIHTYIHTYTYTYVRLQQIKPGAFWTLL